MKNLQRDWNDLWFKTVSTGPVGLVRLAIGLLILCGGLQLWPDRFAWFSEHGTLTTADAILYNQAYTNGPRVITFLYNAGDGAITAFFVVYLLAAFLMTIGLWTRPAIFFVWLGLNAIHNRNMVVNTNGGDQIMLIFSAYLFMARSDGAFSVSRLLRIRAGKEDVNAPTMLIWPQRLMQIQVAVVYLSTFLNKTNGDLWQHGTAVYYPYMVKEFHRFPVPGLNSHNMTFIEFSTYATLAVELALGTLIWVPRLRLYVLLAGVMLHLGIEYAMNIPLFGFLMIGTYLSFLRQSDLDNFKAWLKRLKITLPSAVDLVKSKTDATEPKSIAVDVVGGRR